MAGGGAPAAALSVPAPPGGVPLADPGLDRSWQERVPALVEECAAEWGLQLGEPFPDAFVSYVVAAGDAVLKIQWPHHESEHEAAALEVWDGDGSVRLLAHDPARHALLLERCRPGTYLYSRPAEEALQVIAELLPRLWKPAAKPFRSLAEEAELWTIREDWIRLGRPFDESLVGAAEAALEDLVSSQGEQVLVHQDLHAGNVLAAEREPWLVIDPKPLVGEREFGLAPIVRSFELGHSRKHVLHRLDFLSAELGLDRERARGWAIAQTIAWSFDSAFAEHAEVARWLLEAAA